MIDIFPYHKEEKVFLILWFVPFYILQSMSQKLDALSSWLLSCKLTRGHHWTLHGWPTRGMLQRHYNESWHNKAGKNIWKCSKKVHLEVGINYWFLPCRFEGTAVLGKITSMFYILLYGARITYSVQKLHYGLANPGFKSWQKAEIFFFPHNIQTKFGAQLAYYSMCIGVLFW